MIITFTQISPFPLLFALQRNSFIACNSLRLTSCKDVTFMQLNISIALSFLLDSQLPGIPIFWH